MSEYRHFIDKKKATAHNCNYMVNMLLLEKELTQEQLSELVLIGRTTLCDIERNKSAPSVYIAMRIARVLEKPINEIFIE